MSLPASKLHDLGERHSLLLAHQLQNFRFLAALVRRVSATLRAGRAVLRRLAFRGDLLASAFAGATGSAPCATSADSRSSAFQIRATAPLRLVNFLTGFRSSKGATPAKLFQVSISRETGQSWVSLASSFALEH